MSFAISELSTLLAKDTQLRGVVVAVQGVAWRVATKNGALLATPVGSVVVGDNVTVTNDMAVKVPGAVNSYPG